MRPYIRAAFALGYAEYSADVDEEAIACLTWLMESDADPAVVIEAARHLGKMKGLWQVINHRRNALHRKWNLALGQLRKDLSRKVAHSLAAKHEAATDPSILAALKASLDQDAWEAVLQDAWIDAKAEGNVDAMAYIAAEMNLPSIAFDHEFPQMVDALRDTTGFDAQPWIDKQLEGMAYDVTNDIATALENGATYDDLLSIIDAAITADDGSGPLMLDYMLSSGVSQGSVDQYKSEGVESVDILISPDACDECEELEGDNPYPADEADGLVPVHPNCRCAVTPHFDD